jgi:dienelactone hydrolase
MVARAQRYLDDGVAVLFPDSFGARGVREVCTVRIGARTVTAHRRRLDALGALAYLAQRGDVARSRIAIVGWSHGGSTALQAINAKDGAVRDFRAAHPGLFFRAAVAFYPGCASPLKAGTAWDPAVPTRIHIGELDDWTPARPCVELGHAMDARGADFDVITYPYAYHGFDAPSGRVVRRMDVPNGVHAGKGVTVGPEPNARAVANVRVRAFLRDRLAP